MSGFEDAVIRQVARWLGGSRKALDVDLLLAQRFPFPGVPLYRGEVRQEEFPRGGHVQLLAEEGILSWTSDFSVARNFTEQRHGPTRKGSGVLFELAQTADVLIPLFRGAPAWLKQGLRDHDDDAHGMWSSERECVLFASPFLAKVIG